MKALFMASEDVSFLGMENSILVHARARNSSIGDSASASTTYRHRKAVRK
jgi:hypothetical protein